MTNLLSRRGLVNRFAGSKNRFVKQVGRKEGQFCSTCWQKIKTGLSNRLAGSKDAFVKQVSRK